LVLRLVNNPNVSRDREMISKECEEERHEENRQHNLFACAGIERRKRRFRAVCQRRPLSALSEGREKSPARQARLSFGQIGGEALRRFRLILDYSRRRISACAATGGAAMAGLLTIEEVAEAIVKWMNEEKSDQSDGI